MAIEETMDLIERFYERASKEAGFQSYPEQLQPASPDDIVSLTNRYRLEVPDDVQRFWRRGLRYTSLWVDLPTSGQFAAAYFDWLTIEGVERHLSTFADVAKVAVDKMRRVLQSAIPLTHSQPQLVVGERGALSRFSTRNEPEPPVAPSLSMFLEHWLEAGCFSSENLNEYLPRIRHLVPGRIDPENNVWVKHYLKYGAEGA